MKKITLFAIAVLVCASAAMAQTYTEGSGITGIDKLGAHQNGGRGCVGCHVPHSGVRGNGGTLTKESTLTSSSNSHNATGSQYSWDNQPTISGDVGDEQLWGQDIGPIVGLTINTGGGDYPVDLSTAATKERVKTGIVYCLSCHDGNVAKGAMMTNQSFEQAAGLLPPTYGSQPIPTLLGADGGTAGNYANDHPIGPVAKVSALGATSVGRYVDLDSTTTPTKLMLKPSQPDTKYTTFQSNYGLPTVVGARVGAGFAVETGMTTAGDAYVVCTTCHTPHSMYTATASATNPIKGLTAGTFPSYFFIAAPYNPGANTANGTMASSATQFCRQCHFTGAGGSNEGSNILTIATAF
jgi:hypothetical protein